MKNILLLTLLTLACTASAAEPFPYPVIIAPLVTTPNFQPAAVQALSLTPTLQVYPSPVAVRADRPVAVRASRPAAVAVPARR